MEDTTSEHIIHIELRRVLALWEFLQLHLGRPVDDSEILPLLLKEVPWGDVREAHFEQCIAWIRERELMSGNHRKPPLKGFPNRIDTWRTSTNHQSVLIAQTADELLADELIATRDGKCKCDYLRV